MFLVLIIRRYCRYLGVVVKMLLSTRVQRHKKDGLVPNIISANTERSWNEVLSVERERNCLGVPGDAKATTSSVFVCASARQSQLWFTFQGLT